MQERDGRCCSDDLLEALREAGNAQPAMPLFSRRISIEC
jgi:hypothetical protein